MLVICEGLDRTGKSTLARHLQARLRAAGENARVLHFGAPTRHPLEEYELPIAGHRPDRDHLILDRFHLGEAVWPLIYGRDSLMDDAMALHIELLLRSRGAVLVYAERDKTALKEALVQDGEPLHPDLVELALDIYERVIGGVRVGMTRWNLSEKLGVDRICALAEEAAYFVTAPNLVTSEWVGSPRPRVLLVGDRLGTSHPEAAHVPFVPHRGSCGHFLMKELLEVNLGHDVAICNSTKADGSPEMLSFLWHALHRPRVVALGRAAEALCKRVCIPHATINHPQHARRFERSRGIGAYGDKIAQYAAT